MNNKTNNTVIINIIYTDKNKIKAFYTFYIASKNGTKKWDAEM